MESLKENVLSVLLALGILKFDRVEVGNIKDAHTVLKNAKMQLATYWVGIISGLLSIVFIILVYSDINWSRSVGNFVTGMLFLSFFLTYLVGFGILGLFYVESAITRFTYNFPFHLLGCMIWGGLNLLMLAAAAYVSPIFVYIGKEQALMSKHHADLYIAGHPDEEEEYLQRKGKKKAK